MKNLTLREKIGQMLIIKIQGKEITNETKRMIEEYKVGGIILYRKNYDTYEEMIKLINEIKKSIAGLSDSCICHQRMWENNER